MIKSIVHNYDNIECLLCLRPSANLTNAKQWLRVFLILKQSTFMPKPCGGALAPQQVSHEHVECFWIKNELLTWCINMYILYPRGVSLFLVCMAWIPSTTSPCSLRTLGLWPCSRVFRSFFLFFCQDSGHRFSFLSVLFFHLIFSFFLLSQSTR